MYSSHRLLKYWLRPSPSVIHMTWGATSASVAVAPSVAVAVGVPSAASVAVAPSVDVRVVFRQPELIVGTWKAAKAEDPDITEADAREALLQLDPLWEELFPAEQARIVQLLVKRVDIGIDGLTLRLRVDGLTGLAREIATSVARAA